MSSFFEVEKIMRGIARALDNTLKEHIEEELGFVLITFKFGDPNTTNYVSNADRESVIKGLRETADKLEKSDYMPPAQGGIQ